MAGKQQSSAPPLLYCNPCAGIPPIVIEKPGPFFAAQAPIVVVGIVVMFVLLFIS
jgi:hypothetical protein